MSPTLERLLLRPSVEARVQLDCVELLCVPAEPIPGCQRGLVQDGVPVVVAPSGRTDADVTHSSPIAAFLPTESCWRWITHIHLVFSSNDHPPVAASRPPHNKAMALWVPATEPRPIRGPVGDASPAVDVRSSIASSGWSSMICDTVRGVVGERARVAAVGADRFHPFGPVGAANRAIQRAGQCRWRRFAAWADRCGSRHLAAHPSPCSPSRVPVAVTSGTDCVPRCRTSTRADKNAPISIAAKAVAASARDPKRL